MDKFELIKRTKSFAIKVFFLVDSFPAKQSAKVVSYQLLKSSSSIAANYRAACRAKSKADFINKLKIVEEEADERLFWLEFVKEISLTKSNSELDLLIKEADELVAIFTKALKTLRG
jgi:four helix bundle protein